MLTVGTRRALIMYALDVVVLREASAPSVRGRDVDDVRDVDVADEIPDVRGAGVVLVDALEGHLRDARPRGRLVVDVVLREGERLDQVVGVEQVAVLSQEVLERERAI